MSPQSSPSGGQFDSPLPLRSRLPQAKHQERQDDSQRDELSEEDDLPQQQAGQNQLEWKVHCEFSSPCRMTASPDGMHYRKVVSHVFGRNKASTKLFPPSVWVHYCRKHYQRARYRADQWPFTQCELLLESLRRMEEWGGVENFALTLRRREVMRVDESGAAGNRNASTSGALQSRRKHPTAVTAPVPEWLRQNVGVGNSFDDIRRIILQVREYMVRMREEERKQQGLPQGSTGGGSGSASGNDGLKRSRWRAANARSKGNQRQPTSRVRFPDVEILPTFRPWVLQAALRQRANEQINRGNAKDGKNASDNSDSGDNHESGNRGRNGSTPAAGSGRAGSNRGQSASQRRRSARVFLRMVNRISPRGSVKKPAVRKR
ncbi:uncharacterized protein N7459_000247 [Penicillium hispanicum]|uniref:uncharacterized protein n=1 Tax=Penicillium hispanicum TaxID=1080232 RepID=UPI002540FBCC|nr:uncharacterized protein N7459_000247 [Penicillium hispanicum]KAJ5594039.1 hypothetical protein N7459_000247 [Penicillium hispanicum]